MESFKDEVRPRRMCDPGQEVASQAHVNTSHVKGDMNHGLIFVCCGQETPRSITGSAAPAAPLHPTNRPNNPLKHVM